MRLIIAGGRELKASAPSFFERLRMNENTRIAEPHSAALMRLARSRQAEGDFSGAEAAFRAGVEQFGDERDSYGHPTFRKELMRMFLTLEQWDRAEQLVEGETGITWHQRLFARAYGQVGNLPQAALWWARVIEEAPDDSEAIDWFAHRLLRVPAWPLEANNTGRLEQILRLAASEWERGRREKAADIFLSGLARHGEFRDRNGESLFFRKYAAMAINSADAGHVDQALSRYPSMAVRSFELLHGMLRIRRAWPKLRDAHHRLFDLAVADPLSDFATVARTTRAALSVLDLEAARKGLSRLTDFSSPPSRTVADELELAMLSGDVALCAGELDSAISFYRNAERLSPSSGRAALRIAAAECDRGEWEAAAIDAARSRLDKDLDKVGGLNSLTEYFCRRIDISDERPARPSVDILIFAHATERMKKNAHLAPPCPDMVDALVKSVKERIPDDASTETTIRIMYDHRETELSRAYLANLTNVAQKEDIEIVVNHQNGLRRQWLDGIGRGKGEFLLIIEQDHRILPACPGWGTLFDLFRTRPDVNYLRLNRRSNDAVGFDFFLIQTEADRNSHIARTGLFSNTPHMLRREFFQEALLPLISDNSKLDKQNGGAAGVEENINVAIEQIVSVAGYPAAVRLLGLGIWGDIGAPPMVGNLGL
jgi:tetratricopeptide (TPR) repeat protein